MTKRVLLPITKHAHLNHKILQAAATRSALAFRVAIAPDASSSDKQFIHELRQLHPSLLPETNYFVDFSRQQDVQEAMKDCDAVVVSTGVDNANVLEAERQLVDSAKACDVAQVLKVSCPEGILGERSSVHYGQTHWRMEQHIKDFQFRQTSFVRPNTMMHVFLHGRWFEMVCGRTISVSVKHGKVAFVHAMDVAEAICTLLTSDSKQEASYALTGPEALSYPQIAEVLSQGIGQRVRYSYFPLWAVQPSLWIKGERPEAITQQIEMARALESGAEDQVTSIVQDLLKKPARSFQAFVTEHHDVWPLAAYK